MKYQREINRSMLYILILVTRMQHMHILIYYEGVLFQYKSIVCLQFDRQLKVHQCTEADPTRLVS